MQEPQEERSRIQEFYKDRRVFVTGGTGFLGKVLVEKLLRSTDVAAIFVLVRPKKGKSAHTRLDDLFDDALFDTLKAEKPKFRNRVEAVPGDCCHSGLGLSAVDRRRVTAAADVVLHVAATVNFDEPLKLAYAVNVAGTRAVLELARQMANLKALVHVSTAFSHCPRREISEEFYECPTRWDALGALLEKAGDAEVERLTPRLLGAWPNTYAFTKALGEAVVRELGEGLPIAVFRPSIVISTYREPAAGWIDNLYGPTGVAAGALGGVLRVMRARGSCRADVVPVDTCVAAIVAVASEVSSLAAGSARDIPIFNYVSSPENPVTWDEYINLSQMHSAEYPYSNALWSAFVVFTGSAPLYLLLRALLHTLPAALLDAALACAGRRPRVLALYRKVHKFSDILQYFSTREWTFRNDNMARLWRRLGDRDRELFPFCARNIRWLVFFKEYMHGVRRHLLKDDDATLEYAKRRTRKLDLLNVALKIFLVFLVVHLTMCVVLKLFAFAFDFL